MKCCLWLLFLPGFWCNENVLYEIPQTINSWEGSCVTISCSISEMYKQRSLSNLSFAWYFNPVFDNDLKEYSGSLLYNSNWTFNVDTAPSKPGSNSQVGFVGDLGSRDCSLKISQLHKNDAGTYGIRLYGKADLPNPLFKWFRSTRIQVHESPLEMMEFELPEIKEDKKYIVHCSLFYHCLDTPITLTFEGLEDDRLLSQRMTTENRVVRTQLHFKSTWKDHGKQLTCLLKSQDARTIKSKSKKLKVQYAPRGVTLRAVPGVTIREGDRLSLECIVNSSYPNVTRYQWFKDDEVWNQWKTLSKMEFKDLKDKDSGNYKCTAINPFGQGHSENLRIDVLYPPKVDIQMPQKTIKEKDNVVVQCLAKGNPPIHGYEWYRSSLTDNISTQQELRFEAIQPSDADTYHCVVRNDIGKSNSSVTLSVHYAPKEVQLFHLNHLPIKEGDVIRLNCSVGRSFPTSIWYNFLKSNFYLKRVWNSPLWDISGSEIGSVGAYTCEACNSINCTVSRPITLDVLFGPKDVRVIQKPWQFIREGDSVELICSVGNANPKKLSYAWYKDEQLLPLNSMEKTVLIQNAHSRDSGSYRCEAKNIVAKSWSPTLWLDVHYGPHNVHVTLDNQKAVIEGMDVYLRCDNDAHPISKTYKWYRNGQKIFKETSKIIVLQKVQVKQSGEYLCKASNEISEQESQLMFLTVSYSSATVMKHCLIGLGIFCTLVILLGLLLYSLRIRKKTRSSTTNSTLRSGSFFMKKVKICFLVFPIGS